MTGFYFLTWMLVTKCIFCKKSFGHISKFCLLFCVFYFSCVCACMHIKKKKEWRVQKVSGFEASWVTFTIKWAKSQKVQLSLLETTFCSQFHLLTWMGVTLPAISPECSFENVNLFNSVFLKTYNVLDTVICFSLNCGFGVQRAYRQFWFE